MTREQAHQLVDKFTDHAKSKSVTHPNEVALGYLKLAVVTALTDGDGSNMAEELIHSLMTM